MTMVQRWSFTGFSEFGEKYEAYKNMSYMYIICGGAS